MSTGTLEGCVRGEGEGGQGGWSLRKGEGMACSAPKEAPQLGNLLDGHAHLSSMCASYFL